MSDSDRPWLSPEIAGAIRRTVISVIRRYHRHSVEVDAPLPDGPVLFVANHGFGSLTDPNVLAVASALEAIGRERPQTFLVHDLAWQLKVGGLVAAFDGAPASEASATTAWGQGRDVVVFPGGDLDAGKSFADRNRIVFGGRSGFARLAMSHRIPVVPMVTAGGNEGAFVFSDGQRLASMLRMDRIARSKALPVSLSLPWGLSVGVAAILPYLPLPTRLETVVLPPMTARDGEDAAAYAGRIQQAMQDRLDELAADRVPIIG